MRRGLHFSLFDILKHISYQLIKKTLNDSPPKNIGYLYDFNEFI